MSYLKRIIARLYIKLENCFGRQTSKVIFGFAIFFALIIIDCFISLSGAQVKDDTITVVIDPGHGGNDPGKVSKDGIYEKDVNLSIALKLKKKLEENGVKVVMTRENDVNLATSGATNKKTSDMNNRVDLINSLDADCCVSIHQNSYTDPSVKGAQVFYYGESEGSEKLAVEMQKLLITYLDNGNKRSAKKGNEYFILRKSLCNSVIIECGFLSCPEEAALLVNDKYQEKIADAIADSIVNIY